MRHFIISLTALFTLAATGCSKESDNSIVGEWRGVYDYGDYNDDNEYVDYSKVVIFTFGSDFSATKQTMYYEGSEYLEDISYTYSGTYARSSTTITLFYDDCGCSDPNECNCEYCQEESTEAYEYIYFDTAVDEDIDEDDDDYETYGTLRLRLIDDDDPYTEWVTFR